MKKINFLTLWKRYMKQERVIFRSDEHQNNDIRLLIVFYRYINQILNFQLELCCKDGIFIVDNKSMNTLQWEIESW